MLVAEENEVNAYIFSAMLADESTHIDIACDGLEALALLRSRPYDIAYIDMQMPGLDGLGVTRELRRWEQAQGHAPLPVVSLTANAFASDVQASLDAGSQLHLAKPYRKAELLDSLHRLARKPQWATTVPAEAGGSAHSTGAELALPRPGAPLALEAGAAAHARVFLQDWPSALVHAQASGVAAQRQHLARDLHGVAVRVRAPALQAAAQALLDALASPETEAAVAAAEAQVQQALGPALMALREPPD